MKLHELSPAKGSKRPKKRIGRGPGSGNGVTAGRGNNGQRSRSGYSRRAGFEGGQMPLVRRVPKRGFTNIFRKEYSVVNLHTLEQLEETVVNQEVLYSHGLVSRNMPVKILGSGELTKKLEVHANAFSKSAREKIEAVGGTCEEIGS